MTLTSQTKEPSVVNLDVEDQFGLSLIGKVRTSNQDAILVDPARKLFLLADGMGGYRGGEVAAAIAINTIHHALAELSKHTRVQEEMSRAFLQAGELIKLEAEKSPGLKGMGTTALCVFWYQDHIHIGHVGDSRVYLSAAKAGGQLFQLTRDHSLVVEAELEKDPKKYKEYKNILTRSVGYTEPLVTDYLKYTPAPGDKIMMCSDGLSGLLSKEIIEKTIMKSGSCKNIAEMLIALAYEAGASDNVSVIMIKLNISG